jgi:hypothetical protein
MFLFLLILPFVVFAHPGRTDINGCHTNKKTGDYHCHTKSNKVIRTETKQDAKTKSKNIFGECKTKLYCKEMNSCEEAKYFLNICRLTSLDGDNDGIPCESICK